MTEHASDTALRDDLGAAIDRAWTRLSRPGTWWTAADRIAIAAEARAARSCSLCRHKKAALSPNAVGGEHEHTGRLPRAAMELVHRVVNDAARQTRTTYQATLDQGLTDTKYVEIVGAVVTVVAVDSFRRAAGLPEKELPEPQSGVPTRRRPPGAKHDRAWVPMVAPEDVDPEDADLYSDDRTGYVIRALSLVPDEVRGSVDISKHFYIDDLTDLRAGTSLTRPQIELVASRVSALNECYY